MTRRPMTRRPMTLLALTASIALVVTACGREEGGGDDPGGGETGAEVDTANVTGEIDVWAMGTEGELLPDLAAEFEAAHEGVTVNVTAVPWDGAYDKFANAITAGTTPDVGMIGSTWMGQFVALDALDPAPGSIDSSIFFSGAQSTTEVGGTAYAVPWYVETRMVYYRTDLAEQAGYTEVPTDWEGFQEMAAAMQSEAGADWGISIQPGGTGSWQTVVPFAWTAGAEIATEDAYTFNTPEMLQGVEYFQSFFTEGISNPNPPEGQTEADFVSGAVPMFISGPWMRGLIEEQGGEGFEEKYDVAPIPWPEGGSTSSFVGGSNLGVFAGTDNRDTSWAFVQWLLEPEVQVQWYEMSSDLPSVQAAWEDESLASDEKLAAFGTQLETAQAPPSFPTWEEVITSFDTGMEQVAKADADPQATLEDIQAQAESIGTGQ